MLAEEEEAAFVRALPEAVQRLTDSDPVLAGVIERVGACTLVPGVAALAVRKPGAGGGSPATAGKGGAGDPRPLPRALRRPVPDSCRYPLVSPRTTCAPSVSPVPEGGGDPRYRRTRRAGAGAGPGGGAAAGRRGTDRTAGRHPRRRRMDGADVADLHPRPPRRAAGRRLRRAHRRPQDIRPRCAADAGERARPRRPLAALPLDRQLVPVARRRFRPARTAADIPTP